MNRTAKGLEAIIGRLEEWQNRERNYNLIKKTARTP